MYTDNKNVLNTRYFLFYIHDIIFYYTTIVNIIEKIPKTKNSL